MSPVLLPRIRGRALVIDPDACWSHRLGLWLTRAEYHVSHFVPSSPRAPMATTSDVDVIFCDASFAPGLSPVHSQTAVVVMTTSLDVSVSLAALRLGGVDCLVKPFDERRVRVALRRSRAWSSRHETTHRCGGDRGPWPSAREFIAGGLVPASIDSHPALDAALVRMTTPDPEIAVHGRRVADLVRRLADRFGLHGEAVEALTGAALVHDVPRLVLGPPLAHADGLRTADHLLLRSGPTILRDVFEGAPYLSHAVPIAIARHERWDGTGYPFGLRGGDIPFEARALAVLDTFDTLLQPRPYRRALQIHDALAEIQRGSGSQFDPRLVDLLTAFLERTADSRSAA